MGFSTLANPSIFFSIGFYFDYGTREFVPVIEVRIVE